MKWIILILLFPFACKSQTISTIAGTGMPGYSGDGSAAIAAKLNGPYATRVDRYGNLFIADINNNVVRKIDISGTISTVAGNGFGGYIGDGGTAIAAELHIPIDLAVDSFGNIFVADAFNNVVRKVNTSGVISTIVGNGTPGYTGDGGLAKSAEINHPNSIDVDMYGNIYIVDGGNNVIRKVDTSGIISTVAGKYSAGGTYTGDGGMATLAGLKNPACVRIDNSGNLVISDQFNYAIRKVNTLGIITTIAGNGISGFSGDGGPATAAKINCLGISVDAHGNIYIAGANRIRKVDNAGIITTIAGNGTPGYNGDGINPDSAELNLPQAVEIDKSGAAYIADYVNNRVRKIIFYTAAVNNIPIIKNVDIYPNPTRYQLTINADYYIEKIEIINSLGEMVLKKYWNSKKIHIGIENLPVGNYFVKLNDFFAGKFVKM